MNPLNPPDAAQAPDWLTAEMPAGYQNRLAEIERLTADLRAMDRTGRLLWEIGEPLNAAVRDLFAGFEYDVEPISGVAGRMIVQLDTRRRLLLQVSQTDLQVVKKSNEVAQLFQLLHEVAGHEDRVVLVANNERATHPADRSDAISAEALGFLKRMGANVVATPLLFKLWMVSLEDRQQARTYVDRLHAQDGGAFAIPLPPGALK